MLSRALDWGGSRHGTAAGPRGSGDDRARRRGVIGPLDRPPGGVYGPASQGSRRAAATRDLVGRVNVQDPETATGAGGPDDGPGAQQGSSRSELARAPAGTRARPSRVGAPVTWLGWIRKQPLLAAACLGFCLIAIVGLALNLPRGTLSAGRTSRAPRVASSNAPATETPVAPREAPVSRAPQRPGRRGPDRGAGARSLGPRGAVGAVASRPGPRLSLPDAAAGRRLPVRVDRPGAGHPAGAGWDRRGELADGAGREERRRPHLAGSRGRRVSACSATGPAAGSACPPAIRYRDGAEETLSRRIELSD